MRIPVPIACLAVAALAAAAPQRTEAMRASYLYELAAITGPLSTSAATLSYDPFHQELYVVVAGQVRVYNAVGMEVYAWPDDSELGEVWAVAPLENGDVVTLRYMNSQPTLVRCNFRGELVGEIKVAALSGAFAGDFRPGQMTYAKGKLYLADTRTKMVVIVDLALGSASPVDLAAILDKDEKTREATIDGMTVDGHGNLVVTMAAAFKVFVIEPDGTARSFGRPGSAPGKFGVVKDVVVDETGHFYVSDRLKHCILVFDQDFNFLGEFGYRGDRPGNLVAPGSMVFADGKLYVSQMGRRGVAVFQVAHDR